MGRPRKIKSAQDMERLWEAYKTYCDNRTAIITAFDKRRAVFVSEELIKPVTYTLKGFCLFIGISRSKFYATYEKDEAFRDTIARARGECELDARVKFETGQIHPRLAAIWMGNYGYGYAAAKIKAVTVTSDWVNAVMDTAN